MAAPSSRSEQALHVLQQRLTLKLGGALELASTQVQADGKVAPEVQAQLLELLQKMSHALVGHIQGFAATNSSELVSCDQQIEQLCKEAGVPSSSSSSSQAGSNITEKAVLVSKRTLVAEDLQQAQEVSQKLQAQLQELIGGDARLAEAWQAMQAGGG